ncbi:putative Ig domain-containing protein [Reinekea marina]|uniref:Ig domain-containing protein n=2 Tax=Reinekea marina TaxID=1310421 RepID=A0ABV7WM85_9GAMM
MFSLRAHIFMAALLLASYLQANSFAETPDVTIEPYFCSIYPITLPYELVNSAQTGTVFNEVPLGTGPGNYNWLSWNGTNDANSVASRLVSPGNSDTYINPNQPSDHQLNIGDWVEGAPGVKNSKSIRTGMDAILGTHIILPLYSHYNDHGSNLDYLVSAFAIVRLTDYKLNGKGYISFEFERFTRCYNNRPSAQNLSVQVNEDDQITFKLPINDADNDSLIHTLNSYVSEGQLTTDGDFYTYAPRENFNGNDAFTYQVHDGEQISNEATVSIDVLPVNDAPIVTDSAFELDGNTDISFSPVVTDIDSDNYHLLTHTPTEHGTIDINNGVITYTPNIGFSGEDKWLFQADDLANGPNDAGTNLSNIGTVYFTVIKVNEPPVIISPPIELTNEYADYGYSVVAKDPNEYDVLAYSLDQMPFGMAIDTATGKINWQPDASWTQSVPDFNKQCYVVPTGSVKEYEEGDENNDQAYIAPLFQQVKASLESASVFTAREAVNWHNANGCLGCHVQTQSLLGLQASKDKADVNEVAAEYLLTELLSSQLSDGSIRRSHPQYTKTQTAFALWSLSFVPEIERTMDVRGRALNFMMARQNTNGDQVFWSQDHNSGWMRDYDSITSVVALSGARYLKDLQNLDSISPEQQTYADNFIARIPSIINFELARAYGNENETLWLAFRQIALAELLPFVSDELRAMEIQNAIAFTDSHLRERQVTTGGWARYGYSNNADPLTSAWVGLALNYLDPPLTDTAVTSNIEYLLDSQSANGTWVTNSGLFTTHLATTSLVMAYLPIAMEHLGNPDIHAGTIHLLERESGVHSLSATISNRGLADITAPITVNFYNGKEDQGDLLGSVLLTNLLSGEIQQPSIDVEDHRLTDHVYITLASASTLDECEITNNSSHAAIVRARVTDPSNESDTQIYALNVIDVNEAPLITSEAPSEHQGGQGLKYKIEITDGDVGDGHRYSIISGPANVYVDAKTGVVTAAPGSLAPGTYEIVVQVEDLRGATATQTITFVVFANDPPSIVSIAVEKGNEQTGYEYDVDAIDPNNDVLKYALEKSPQGSWINKNSGLLNWVGASQFVEPMTETNDQCIGVIDQNIGGITSVVKWSLNYPNSNAHVFGPVNVAQMTDDNNDGLINQHDDTDIIFVVSQGGQPALTVADGATGQIHWNKTGLNNSFYGSTAVADTDKDGIPEIFVTNNQRTQLLKVSSDGQLIWQVATGLPAMTYPRDGVAIADLNADGTAEIIVGSAVFSTNGVKLWNGTKDFGGDRNYGFNSVVADVDLDGYQEVIAGRSIYGHDGTVKAHVGELNSDGFTAVGNFDDDEFGEIVLVGGSQVSLFNHDGSVIWKNVSLTGGGYGGAPTIGDFDGDGLPEIGVAGARYYFVFEHDGTLKWFSPTRDSSSHRTGSSLFDFNSDGKIEVVYADEYFLRVYDGETGTVLIEESNRSGTTLEYPVIADVDNDGYAEIIVGSSNISGTLRVLESSENNWAPTRSIWNQHAYNINNINDDLTVPASPVKSWLTHNTFRLNTFPDRPALGQADLTVHDIRFDEATSQIFATVLNRGLAPITGAINVTFTHEHSWTGDTLLGEVSVNGLLNSQSQTVAITIADTDILEQTIRVDVTPNEQSNECLTDNNQTRAVVMQASVYDEAGLFDIQTFAASITNVNDSPSIISSASFTATENAGFSFNIDVSDADVGDDHRYELLNAPVQISIDANTGKLESDGLPIGAYPVLVKVYDLVGASAEQTILITVTTADNYAPIISSDPVESVNLGDQYSYQVIASDPDGDAIQFFMSRTQPGLSIDADSGLILWTPVESDLGLKSAEVSVIDQNGAITKQYFLIDVIDSQQPNHAPIITSVPSGVVYAGKEYLYPVIATDEDGDALTYSVITDEPAITINQNGVLQWLPAFDLVGQSVIVEIQVNDSRGGIAIQKLTLPVNASANHPPIISSVPNLSAYVDEPYSYSIIASDEDGDAFTFELLEQANGMSLVGNLIQWSPSSVQLDTAPNVTIKVTDARGAASTQSFSVYVNAAVIENSAPVITSIPNGSVYAGVPFTYAVTATDADNDTLTYSIESNRSDILIDSVSGLLSWSPTVDDIGNTIELTVNVNDGRGGIAWQKLSLPVNDTANSAPLIQSQPSLSSYVDEPYHYLIIASDAEGDAITLTLLDAPEGMTLVGDRIQWTPLLSQGDTAHQVTLKATDARGAASTQSFSVYVNSIVAPNQAPTIISSPTSPAIVGQEYQYNVIAVDADGDTLVYSLASAIEGTSLNQNGALRWTPTIDQIGTHSLSVQVSDNRAMVTQTFLLDVIADGSQNQAPIITSTPLTVAVQNQAYKYAITATDPDGDSLSYGSLTLPIGATLADNLLTWSPTADQIGIHDVVVFADDGNIRALQSYTIAVTDTALPIDAFLNVEPQHPNFGDIVSIQLLANGGQNALFKTVTVNGTEYTLDAYGRTNVLANQYGISTVIGTVTDGIETITEEDYFTVVDPSDSTPPTITLHSPTDNATVTAPTDVIATIQDANLRQWQLIVSEQDSAPTDYQIIATGNSNVDNGVIGQFDPTLLTNGQYQLVIFAEDTNGLVTQEGVNLLVEGDFKVGNFSITFEDVNVPVAGIPIRVTRTYDSRRRHERLDFGYGWSVGYQDVKVHESRVPGSHWALNEYSGAFGIIPVFCVEPQGAPVVSVSLPGGDVEKFEMAASPKCNNVIPIKDVSLVFNAMGDTQSKLEALDETTAYLNGGNLVETGYFSSPVNPNRYKLTTKNGYVYFLNQGFGVDKVIDPNGHTLTYTENGIIHSSGKSIEFVRNAYGQIENIIDPAGNIIEYRYDANGDLINAIDTVSFVNNKPGATYNYYGQTHGLNEMFDPLDRRVIKNIYDEAGRLDYQEDSNGNIISFDHDLEGRVSTVTDREFRTKVFAYDTQGNVLNEIKKAQGIVYSDDIESVFAYDANGNQTSSAVGGLDFATTAKFDTSNNQEWATNALGQTVFYRDYNEKGQEGEIEDELGRVHTMQYDVIGNLYRIEGPEYQDPVTLEVKRDSASNVINSRGLVESTTDMSGNTTHYTYYPKGHAWEDQKKTESTQVGGTVTYTYDDNLNVTTETRERTVDGVVQQETVAYEYDIQNRLTVMTYPDGSYTQTRYDLTGNAYEERDRFGVWTEHEFDAYGRTVASYYADGTSEHWTFYAEGNVETHISRGGIVTLYEYDDFGRQWKVHNQTEALATGLPSFTETKYTPQGWVEFEWDAERNLTEYKYNVAGQRVSVIRHDGKGNTFEHSFTYYDNGELHTETDANGHTTTYEINEQDQRVKTIFHDGTDVEARYDAMGVRTHGIDQNERRTRFGYDDLGRLTEVQPEVQVALNGFMVDVPVTTYSYDEVGNKLTQTDAKGHTTRWTYDYFGQTTSRTLPEGQQEQTEYSTQMCTDAAYTGEGDDVCQVITHTDFNGQVTTTLLDAMGRTERIDFHDGSFKAYTYWPDGQVNTITTEQGTISYTYDSASRLAKETQIDGSVLSYLYDRNGNRTQLTVRHEGISTVTDFTYDGLNRLETVTDGTGTTVYTYDAVGNLDTVTAANGNVTDYDYTTVNQLWQLTITNASNEILSHYVYDLDATGRREFITEHHSNRTIDNVYDALYRLTGEHITDAVNGDYHASYQYDLVGNRTYETVDGVQTAYSYNKNDWLTQTGGSVFGYDDNGNTTSETLDGQTTVYTYNAQNQLVSTNNTGTVTQYRYNPSGIRSQKIDNVNTIDEITTDYIVDENRDYAQVLMETENGQLTVTYQYGHDLLSQTRTDADETHFFQVDGLGSTRQLTDTTGSITDSYNYEAFGTVLNQTGTTENSYLYTGEQYDTGLDQYYLRARYYDQNIGRFTQMDTWMGSNHDPITLHKYLYANADPVTYTDPTGKFSLGSVMTSVRTMGSLAMRGYNTYDNAMLLIQIANGDMTMNELAITFLASKFLPRRFFKCNNSFIGSTLVHTENGLVAIETIKIGDKVWAFDESTGEKTLEEVIHVITVEGSKELVDITLENGDAFTATTNHPIYSYASNNWIDAGSLAYTDQLMNINGDGVSVLELIPFTDVTSVYNFSVANSHTYYVGEVGELAHNCYQKPKSINYKKHVPKKKWTKQETINATKNGGNAKYFIKGTENIQKFELNAWKKGVPTTNGKPWKVAEFPEEIGAYDGKAVRWLRLEYSEGGNVIHGHPISLAQYRKLLK